MATGFDDKNVIGLLEGREEKRFEGNWLERITYVNDASDSVDEEYGFFGGFGKMREWIGARQLQTTAQKSYVIRNKKFEASLSVPRPLLERDKSKLLRKYVDAWYDRVPNNHWEDLVIDLINTNGNCYDATPFVGTTHTWDGGATTQKNQIAVGDLAVLGAPADPVNPTPTEMAGVILGMAGWMLTFVDDKGRDINGDARDFTVCVNTVAHLTAATQALASNFLTGIVDNPLTGLKQAGFTFTLKFVRRLTGTNKIRMFRNDALIEPFILQQEKAMEIDILTKGSDYTTFNDANLYALNCRRGAGYGLWESALEATIS